MCKKGGRRSASVYKRYNGYFFSSISRPMGAFDIESPPYTKVESREGDAKLGEALLTTLDSYQDYCEFNEHDKEKHRQGNQEELQQLAGVKSQTTFHRTAKNVGIELLDKRIIFNPTKKSGMTYLGLPEHKFDIASDSDIKTIGENLRKAFDMCEPKKTRKEKGT